MIRAMYQAMAVQQINNDVAEDSAATAEDSAATADTLSVTRTIILLAVLMLSAGVICLTLYRRKENA